MNLKLDYRKRSGWSLLIITLFFLAGSFVMWLYGAMSYRDNFYKMRSSLLSMPPQLYTVRYGLDQVVCYNRNFVRWLQILRGPGTSIACFRVVGEVIAGYDLSALKVKLKGSASSPMVHFGRPTVVIYLPKPEILSFRGINYELLYSRNWHKFPPEERSTFVKKIQEDMKKEALGMGILKEAQRSIRRFLYALSETYGFSVELKEASE